MAVGEGSSEPDEDDTLLAENGKPTPKSTDGAAEDDSEEEDEEEEPRLKYATLTKSVSSLYRNGDASSAVLVAGDKMIVGTHNGNIHVLSLPALQSLKVYHAHTASVSAVSISPYPPPLPALGLEGPQRLASQLQQETTNPSKGSPGSKNSPKQPPVPVTPSNQIHIATSSIDGNVCVASLVDEKDVQLRNFGRPVQTVALSPDYKNDRTYLSGGQAGNLILTTGGQAGKIANATTTGAAAAASGWLGSIGLGSNTGTDKVLHSGEGTISTIKWSRSGKYVLWVNGEGIKIMRSNLKLESGETEWTRISHVDRPARPGWEDMAGVWKARVEWIERENLETEDDAALQHVLSTNGDPGEPSKSAKKRDNNEEVVVGWGDNVWILKIYPGGISTGKEARERKAERAEIITK
jgi:vacuolar protein sorting-associated protein 41